MQIHIFLLILLLTNILPANPTEDSARLSWLNEEIERHDDLYWKELSPEISDWEYDALTRARDDLAARMGAVELQEKTAPVSLDHSDHLGHLVPMLSLKKAWNHEDVTKFITDCQKTLGDEELHFRVEAKMDGVAVNLIYREGRLVAAFTRGDGRNGENVLEMLKVTVSEMRHSLLVKGIPEWLELRGEVVIERSEMNRINQLRVAAGVEPYSGDRNVVAGTLRMKAPPEDGRQLKVLLYGWGAGGDELWPDIGSFRQQVRLWGLPEMPYSECMLAEKVTAALQKAEQEQGHWPVRTDGLVVKLEDTRHQLLLGSNAKVLRWAIAYKVRGDRALTRLIKIHHQVSPNGRVTPVGEIEPVVLGGATIQRVNLHSEATMLRMGVEEGDLVEIERTGDVIPQVVAVIKTPRDLVP